MYLSIPFELLMITDILLLYYKRGLEKFFVTSGLAKAN